MTLFCFRQFKYIKFGDTFDRAITFGDTFSVSPPPKIDFGTFQLGIVQLVPRVSGSPSPPSPLPAPKPRERKKKFWKKKFRTLHPLPPPYWLEIDGSNRKKYPLVTEKTVGVSAGHETSRWPWTFSRARSSNQTRTVHQRSTNQIRPHCTATYLGQLSAHLPHKVAPALFGPGLLCFGLSNRPILPRGQTLFRPKPTTLSKPTHPLPPCAQNCNEFIQIIAILK